MYFPKLKAQAQQRAAVEQFGGLDRRVGHGAGCAENMENMWSSGYPALETRPRRGVMRQLTKPHGIVEKDGLFWVDGTALYVNGAKTELVLSDSDKQLVSMGAYLIVFPDKVYLNTKDLTDWGSLECSRTAATGSSVSLCDAGGEAYSGVVESASIKVAGDQFNEAVVKYMRRKHNVLVGERTAELMKMEIGCVFPKEQETSIEIKGRCLMTGLPKVITVTSTEMLEAFEEPVERILEAVHGVLERTPPELVADISDNGIVMTGGGSLVDGFDKLITARTGIHTMVAEDAISCVAEGTGKSLDSLNAMTDGTVNLSRRKQMN